jgi:hypothetical protein
MSSRQQNAGLTTLYVLLFAQVVCFFLNAVDNFFAVFSLTFVGHKGAALAKPVVQINNVVLIGHTLMFFYLVCCLIFFFLPIALVGRVDPVDCGSRCQRYMVAAQALADAPLLTACGIV